MPQFINCQIEDNNNENNNHNNSSQTSPINYSQDEIAAAMTLIDLSASPRSIAKRMLAEDLVQKGIGFPNSNDSQAQTKAQAEVANNLVQQIKKKREAVAIQQQILSNQILQQTQILQRLSSNDMDTSENGNAAEKEEIMKQVQNFVKSTNSTKDLVGTTNSLISSAQQFQNSIKTNNNTVFPNPFNRQSSQLTTNTEEINVDDEIEEENHENNNNNSWNQQQQQNQLNASQAQLLLAKIQQQQQQNVPDTSLSARIASALNQNISENNNNITDQESVEISENVQNNSFQSPIIQMPTLAGSLTTTVHSPTATTILQPVVPLPQMVFQKNPSHHLTVKTTATHHLLPHSAPNQNSISSINTNPINVGKNIQNSVQMIKCNTNGATTVVGDSLLTNSCLSGSPTILNNIQIQNQNINNNNSSPTITNLQNHAIHNIQSLQSLKNLQHVASLPTVNSSSSQNVTALNLQNLQNHVAATTTIPTTLTSTNTNSFQLLAQQNQILKILQNNNNNNNQNNNSQSSTNTSARGTLANTPITTANIKHSQGVIINQLISKNPNQNNHQRTNSNIVKSLPVLTSTMSPQVGKNGQILNPLMNTGGYMKQTVGGPMEVTPRSRTTSTGGTRKRGDSKKCRKVYGIEHKDQWCKACIWKKACQRFPD